MDKWMKKTVELASGIFLTGEYNPAVVPYTPTKTMLPKREPRSLPRVNPERVGLSSGRILALLSALEKERRANIHSIVIAKDGAVISECSHPGYSTNVWHLGHSMSKSITAIAVGMMVDDGRLSVDDRLCDLFPEYSYADRRFAAITVKNLLNMTSGVRFAEAGVVSSVRWTEDFFSSSLAFAPGTDFNYNSMNSYILARIVCKLSGRSLTSLLRERLFSPLGITSYFWELGPEGVEKGGWGLYMSPESWCKVGIMMLNGGVYNGTRVVSSDWVRECTSQQAEAPTTLGNYNYGYQMWVSRDSDAFLFNGLFGQDVWVFPTNRTVVAVSSGNNELFQKSPTLYTIETYLGRELTDDLGQSLFAGDVNDLRRFEDEFFVSRHWIRPYRPRRSRGLRFTRRTRSSVPPEWNELVGRFNFVKNSQGILPLILRAMQNNLKNSIDGFIFESDRDSFWFTVVEAGVSYSMEVGFSEFKESVIDYHGEKYLVRVMGEAMEDEDRNMLYKIELIFPELPNTRTLKLSFEEDGALKVRMNELPNNRIADLFVRDMREDNPKLAFFYDLINKKLGKNFVETRLDAAFAPVLYGARVGSVGYTVIMDREREKLRVAEKNAKVIKTVIERLFHEDESDEVEWGGIRQFFGDIVDRIKQKLPQKPRTSAKVADASRESDALIPYLPAEADGDAPPSGGE